MQKLRKIAKNGCFPAKVHHKNGQVLVVRRGYLPKNRAAELRPSASHVPLPLGVSYEFLVIFSGVNLTSSVTICMFISPALNISLKLQK